MKQEVVWGKRLRWFAEDFASIELLNLQNGDWDKLKKDLREVIYPGHSKIQGSDYDLAFDRVKVGEAQRHIRGVLEEIAARNKQVLKNDPKEHPNNRQQKPFQLPLEGDRRKSVIDGKVLDSYLPTKLFVMIEPDGDVWAMYSSTNLATMLYMTFHDALMYSGLARHILTCDNRDHPKKLYVSKRKPRADRNGHYCTYRCCHVESTRRNREADVSAQSDRDHKNYKAKIEKRQGRPTKVQRRIKKKI